MFILVESQEGGHLITVGELSLIPLLLYICVSSDWPLFSLVHDHHVMHVNFWIELGRKGFLVSNFIAVIS